MATDEGKLVSAFQEKVSIRSSFNLANMFSYVLINFWEQTISKWPLRGHFEFYKFRDGYLIQKMQNSWTMNIKKM